MLLVILLPIVFGLLVGIAVGDVEVQKVPCPPHTWSYVHMADKLVCLYCNKESHISPFI